MALPAWPSTVSFRPEIDSFAIEPYLAPIETPMDGGNIRSRPRPGDNIATVTQSIWMVSDNAQNSYADFIGFVKGTLNNGSARFTMTVWNGVAYVPNVTTKFVGGGPKVAQKSFNSVLVAMKLYCEGLL